MTETSGRPRIVGRSAFEDLVPIPHAIGAQLEMRELAEQDDNPTGSADPGTSEQDDHGSHAALLGSTGWHKQFTAEGAIVGAELLRRDIDTREGENKTSGKPVEP